MFNILFPRNTPFSRLLILGSKFFSPGISTISSAVFAAHCIESPLCLSWINTCIKSNPFKFKFCQLCMQLDYVIIEEGTLTMLGTGRNWILLCISGVAIKCFKWLIRILILLCKFNDQFVNRKIISFPFHSYTFFF